MNQPEINAELKSILEKIESLEVSQLVILVKALQERFGISDASLAGSSSNSSNDDAGPAPTQQAKTEFDVILSAAGPNKISVIKIVKELTGFSLKDAKDLVEAAPKALKGQVSKEDAEAIKKKIEEVGGSVTLQ